MTLLEVQGLSVAFPSAGREISVVDGVDLQVDQGETLAIVGESGCGKSVTGLSMIGLTPSPGQVTAGAIRYDGRDLLRASKREWQEVRGREIGMIFQDPLTSLDPIYTAGEQVAEGLRSRLDMSARDAWTEAVRRLDEVGIPDPAVTARSYPHQLSGGMRQRVMIAAAIACRPRLVIADEPTTALDVTIQLQILDLLRDLQQREGMALIIITHDLGIVAHIARRVAVMYAGQIVETGATGAILDTPAHPYTAGLISSVPRIHGQSGRLTTIEGVVPAPGAYPTGCRFRPRCSKAGSGCDQPQELKPGGAGRLVRCRYPLSE